MFVKVERVGLKKHVNYIQYGDHLDKRWHSMTASRGWTGFGWEGTCSKGEGVVSAGFKGGRTGFGWFQGEKDWFRLVSCGNDWFRVVSARSAF